MYQTPHGRKREIIAALAVLIIIVAIVATATVTNKKKPASTDVLGSSATSAKASTGSTTSNIAPATNAPTAYKDGSYTARGTYDSPGGSESITISLTLKDNVITDTSAKSGAQDPEAEVYQGQFIDGYKQKVVGKSIDNLRLSRVSGSSLTSQGFNQALAQIKQQAKGS